MDNDRTGSLITDGLRKRSRELYDGYRLTSADVAYVMELLAIIIKSLYGSEK